MKIDRKGSIPILLAVGTCAVMATSIYFSQMSLAVAQKRIHATLKSIDGFYGSEVAMLHALQLDRTHTVPISGAGATGEVGGLNVNLLNIANASVTNNRIILSTSLLGGNSYTDRDSNFFDLSKLVATLQLPSGSHLGYRVPSGAPPKVICGVLEGKNEQHHACLYRTPAFDPTGLDPEIVKCAESYVNAGIPLPFTNEQLKHPRVVNRVYLVGGILSGPLVDNVTTTEPELIHIKVTSLVNVFLSMQLLNPKGFYCITRNSLVSVFSGSTLSCTAKIASSQLLNLYDIFPNATRLGDCN